jgi:glutamate carboxypeptidase
MGELSSTERQTVDGASAEPMLDQVLAWSAINSGSHNLPGLERMAESLADALATQPGNLPLS